MSESLQEENKRLKQWVKDLQDGTWVTCVYCGHRYGPDHSTPACLADKLKEHVMHCPEHPMNKLRELVLELWQNRKYGIKELELHQKVQRVIPDEIVGVRPCDAKGVSLIPEIKDGKISYTHHFEA